MVSIRKATCEQHDWRAIPPLGDVPFDECVACYARRYWAT